MALDAVPSLEAYYRQVQSLLSSGVLSALAAFLVVVGFAFWLWGRGLARWVFALTGGAVGVLAAPVLGTLTETNAQPLTLALATGGVGFISGLFLHRACLVVVPAFILAIVAGAIYHHQVIVPAERNTQNNNNTASTSNSIENEPLLTHSLARATRVAAIVGVEYRSSIDPRLIRLLFICVGAGALAGIGLGIIGPQIVTVFWTSGLGAAMWIGGIAVAIHLLKPDMLAHFSGFPWKVPVMFAVATLVGATLQFQLGRNAAVTAEAGEAEGS